jgi:hypothetical protein
MEFTGNCPSGLITPTRSTRRDRRASRLFEGSQHVLQPPQPDNSKNGFPNLPPDIEAYDRSAAAPTQAASNVLRTECIVWVVSALTVVVSAATVTAYKLEDRYWLHTPSFVVLGDRCTFDWAGGGVNFWGARPGEVAKQLFHLPGWCLIGIADCVLWCARYELFPNAVDGRDNLSGDSFSVDEHDAVDQVF